MQANSIHHGFDQGVHTALAMDPAVLNLIGVVSLIAIVAVGLLAARAVFRFITR